MDPPDVTNEKDKWIRLDTRTSLWQNVDHPECISKDRGRTYTISTEREAPDKPRQVRETRKV